MPKISSGTSALRHIFIAERDTLISKYDIRHYMSLYFDYCYEVWDVFGEIQSKRLQKRQNRAARHEQ